MRICCQWWQQIDQIAGFPRGVRRLRGQLQVKDGAALAAGVQVLALHQRPGGAGEGGGTGGVGQGAGIQVQRGGQGVLPVGQGGSGVAGLVGLKAFVQRLGLLGVQPRIQRAAKAAKLAVVAVAQGQQAVLQRG